MDTKKPKKDKKKHSKNDSIKLSKTLIFIHQLQQLNSLHFCLFTKTNL
ncbi:hypothetical protein HanXRQr2_Chr04g0182121 [Helianthus annuus]|uniref:Uncharacterized protein n=1 Tax=Helianthus annuus TaxID=4232 RepID=A0A9K3JAN6_HELAN|nr:hypothetical protein HanXRQr2_Chr04g0182121 [Helianthus annuus]